MNNKVNAGLIEWWNQIAEKLDGYRGTYNVEFDGTNGEEQFLEIIKGKLFSHSKVLDVGCADGSFTIELAPFADKIVGIDLSPVMIDKAKNSAGSLASHFFVADGKKLPFEDHTFDLVFSRRGPVSLPGFLEEAIRVTKPGGHVVEITIGDKDAIELKRIFNRGQDYSDINKSRYLEIKDRLEMNDGIRISELHEYYCNAIYPTLEDVCLLLSSTPIIDDFDISKDYKHIEAIKQQLGVEGGIRRTYHRLIWVATKLQNH